MATQRANPIEKRAALFLIHQRNELESNLERKLFEAEAGPRDRRMVPDPVFFFSTAPISTAGWRSGGGSDPAPDEEKRAGDQQKRQRRAGPGIRHMAAHTTLAR